MAYPGAAAAQTQMYQLEVPSGVGPGQQFQAQVGDRMMVITCPTGAGPGSTIQVAGPSVTVTGVRSSAPPTVTGVPVGAHGASGGVAYGGSAYGGGGPNVVLVEGAPEGFVEVDEISPAGGAASSSAASSSPSICLASACGSVDSYLPRTSTTEPRTSAAEARRGSGASYACMEVERGLQVELEWIEPQRGGAGLRVGFESPWEAL
eukprot:CAMPEP_0119070134 /NCGR_PEP_ID=MMETSP1178-20130426/34907_1 /TAXON_ID=33656 /ORGANISM="unid sp, Strain CCMP2000" /LENGTH=205 /DNA_ID=CAMNT_0007051945 /DNA_START=22 /DNA_END=640 /DNA_ORIENTATION=+